jgi:hypothetical protein
LEHKHAGLREWGVACCWLLLVVGGTLRPVLASETCAAGPGAATDSVVARYGTGLDFDVYRNDREVGRHETRFSRENGYLVVRSMLDLSIKLLFIEAYHYRYEATEYWCDNQLMRLAATVDDDGGTSLAELADDLVLELDELLPILDAGELLQLMEVEEGQLRLTAAGQQLRAATIFGTLVSWTRSCGLYRYNREQDVFRLAEVGADD